MSQTGLHPGIILLAGALGTWLARGNARRVFALTAAAAALSALAGLSPEASWTLEAAGFTLELLRVDALSRLFGAVFCVVALLGVVYGLHKDDAEPAAWLALAGAALGAVLAGDWITLFLFWEAMTVASLAVIWLGEAERARGAGLRYLIFHALGAGALLTGILLHLAGGGDPRLGAPADAGPAYWLLLLGVLVNAAAPPLHPWLTDAYPECSVAGSVVQSAFTTKTAVYLLLRAFPGAEPLAAWGAAMALYGVLFAVLENDIRRLLAYHIISQVGFMVAGVGLGTPLALDGAAAHAFCHILYKALLFMGAGALVEAAGTGKLTELGGLARRLPWTCLFFMVGALSISGLPPLSGFVSKGMTMAAAEQAQRGWIWAALELASVGTFLSIGLKLAAFAFWDRESGHALRPLPPNMHAAMAAAAALCAVIGLRPELLYALLPYRASFEPYSLPRALAAVELHLGAALAFWFCLRAMAPKDRVQLDIDWLYRGPLGRAGAAFIAGLKGFGDGLAEGTARALAAAVPGYYPVDRRRRPLGATLFWAAALFSGLALLILRA